MDYGSVLGYPVHTGTKSSLLQVVSDRLEAGEHTHIVTLNPEMLMQGEANPELSAILKQADIILPDGAGVVWALKRKKFDVTRIPGIEFSEALLEQSAKSGEPVAMIGAAEEVNDAVCARLERKYPGLNIAYRHHGYFSPDADQEAVAQACAEARPRYVFIALGVPKQEYWIGQYRRLFSSPTVFVGVGGSFDVWSGLKKRAHPLFLKFNLEWLWRITSEPWRLKRVTKTLPMFVVKVLLSDDQASETQEHEYRHAAKN